MTSATPVSFGNFIYFLMGLCLKTKAFFSIMRMMQKNGWNEADVTYWKEKGWLEKKRPWKKK